MLYSDVDFILQKDLILWHRQFTSAKRNGSRSFVLSRLLTNKESNKKKSIKRPISLIFLYCLRVDTLPQTEKSIIPFKKLMGVRLLKVKIKVLSLTLQKVLDFSSWVIPFCGGSMLATIVASKPDLSL